MSHDVGWTHVAVRVANLERSAAFYARYARMEVVHRREDPRGGSRVAWLCDGTRPFVLVLLELPRRLPWPLVRLATRLIFGVEHLGVGCTSREEVEALCARAREEGCLRKGPSDAGPPVGYWALLADPDGHVLEISFGQEVGLTVEQHRVAGLGEAL